MKKFFGFLVSFLCAGIWSTVFQKMFDLWWVTVLVFFGFFHLCYEIYKSSTYENYNEIIQKRLNDVIENGYNHEHSNDTSTHLRN